MPTAETQFSYLNDQAREHLAAGGPMISVDTKEKELSAVQNAGTKWRPGRDHEQVKVQDFIDPDLGKAKPHGVRNLSAPYAP